MPKYVPLIYSDEREISSLLNKPCNLSAVKIVDALSSEEPHEQFMLGALFARICAEATSLNVVFM